MRHIGGYVKKVASSSDEMLFESLAEQHPGFSAEDVNGSFMVLVLVHLGSFTGWNSRDLQIDSLRPHGLGGDSRRRKVSLLRINAPRGRRVAPSRVRHLVRTGLHASTATASQHWLNAGRLQNESMLADIGLTYSEYPRPVRFGRR